MSLNTYSEQIKENIKDVDEVFSKSIRTREDGTLAVDYEKLATLSFGAIKSLLARVEALEAK